MRKVKLFFTMLMLMAFSVGNVWAAETVYKTALFGSSYNSKGVSGYTGVSFSSTNDGFTVDVVNANNNNNGWSFIKIGGKNGAYTGTITTDAAIDKAITKVDLTIDAITAANVTSITLKTSSNGTSWSDAGTFTKATGTKTVTLSSPTANLYYKIEAVCTKGSSNGLLTISKVEYYAEGGTPNPTVTADPEEVTDVVAAGVANQTIGLTYDNISDYETEVSVHPNADGTGTLSPAWLTASVTDADDYATVTYSVSANEGAARTAYIKVYTTDGDKEATTIIPVSQVKYSAPTGTFELFTGDIEEGDYVIYYGGGAMNTTVTSNRLQYLSVTPSENKIVNPDEAIVWHIAASGDYWTLYNAAVEKYAASTGSKNQATMAAGDLTDNMKWSITGSSTYEFENLARSNGTDPGNKWLRKNGTYGFACYSSTQSGTGPLTLYKKQVAGQPATPEFSVAEGNYEEAQSVEISCATIGAKIYYTLDGSKPTSASTEYSTAIPVSATTTIKAVAIKDDIESTVASATYTIVVWQTVDEIWSSITSEGPTNANVWGYVSQANVGGYNNNYYISVDGSLTANQLEIYKGDNAGNTVAVGDKVHVNGDLTIFNEIKEFKQNTGVIVHYAAKGALQSVAVSGTPTKTEYAANEDFDPAGLVVTGTYANGYVGVITEGITWGNDLTDGKVTENTTVHVTATVSGITNDPAYDVPVTVAAKTLVSIAVGTAAYTIYTGEALPQPVVTATYSEGEPEDVSAYAVYDSESVFNTATIDDPDPQTITVSYTFGGATQTDTYTVSVKDYENADNAPYSVTEALHIITAAIGNTESAREIVVTGTVSEENISNNKNRYKISDSTNELLVYAGKGFNNENFTNTNYPKVGDVVKVKGKVINYNNNTPEFASGKSYLLSQVRPATLAIEDVASLEVGATDLAENDLDITTASDGDITFVSGDDTKATIVANAIHAVAPGTVTITANLAATENDDALNYAAASTTFSVTVVAPAMKYAITFDGNGADGGSAPDAIADKAAGAEVTLPANSYTKTGYVFDGWKVYDENQDEVTVTAGAFEMPASDVVIKAQWAEISAWATTYTSNLELKGNSGTKSYAEKVKITVEEVLTEFDALRACTGSAAGSCTVKVPAGTQTLHFHAAAWNAKTSTITVTMGETELMEQDLTADAGIKSSSPYTLEGIPYEYYYSIDLSSYSLTEETTITFSAGSDKRFVLFGVNQEGGVLPVLQSLAISGDLENKTYEAGQSLNMTGLTVMGTYNVGDPVDVTDQVEEWLYDALEAGDESVTIAAKIGTVTSAGYEISGLTVTDPTPQIYVNKLNVNFGTVATNAGVDDQTITVTLTNVASVTASLGGTNPEAFNISPASLTESGDITISFIGSTATAASYAATVTISDGAEGAEDKTVNLSLKVENVESAVSTTSEWVVATAADLVDGAEVLITGVKSEVTYAMSEQANNNRTTAAGTLAEGVFTPGDNTMSFTLVEQASGKFALLTSNGKYLYAASSSSNQLKTRDDLGDDGKAVWSISIDGENKASIVANCETTNWRNTMRFNLNNPNPPVFTCYASATQNDVILYVPKPAPAPEYETVRSGLEINRYYTVCLPKKVTAIKGASFWTLNNKSQDGATAYLEEETNNLPFAAGKPFIIQATAENLEVVYEGDATEVAGTNGALHGTLVYMDAAALAAAGGSDVYMLFSNALRPVGENNHLDANRAYVLLSELNAVTEAPQSAPGRRVRAMPMQPQVATGFEAAEANEAPRKVLINGEFFIIRGEKMYDAKGQLVK